MKLTRVEDSDIFYLADDEVKCLGEILIKGNFEVIFNYALKLRNELNIDLGSGDSVAINSSLAMTNIIDAKWYVIFLNLNKSNILIQIVRTSGKELYSLPTNFVAYQEPLINIFNRVFNLIS